MVINTPHLGDFNICMQLSEKIDTFIQCTGMKITLPAHSFILYHSLAMCIAGSNSPFPFGRLSYIHYSLLLVRFIRQPINAHKFFAFLSPPQYHIIAFMQPQPCRLTGSPFHHLSAFRLWISFFCFFLFRHTCSFVSPSETAVQYSSSCNIIYR